MSNKKKSIRSDFRNAVLARDKYQCKICGWKEDLAKLGAHHITDRNLISNGGYCVENGITLCPDCHIKAEHFHSTGIALPKFLPEDLYKKINSSLEKAEKAAQKLK